MDTCQPDVIENILERYTPNFRIVDWLKLDDAEFEKSVEEIISGLQISEEECAGVEVMTRGQSLNKNWGKVRCVLLTASNFGLICKRKSSTPPDNLIKTLVGIIPYQVMLGACNMAEKWKFTLDVNMRNIMSKNVGGYN